MLPLKSLMTIVLCLGFGCNHKEDDRSKQDDLNSDNNVYIKKLDPQTTNKELLFKRWLLDTLQSLKSIKMVGAKQSKNPTKITVVSADSLDLSIIDNYDLIMSSSKRSKEDVNKLLALLQEYEEYPKGNFKLKFKAIYNYVPSPVPALTYDLIFKINDLEIIEENGKIRSQYSYVRGRLSYKNKINTSSKQTEHVTFIWDGNKLNKKRTLY